MGVVSMRRLTAGEVHAQKIRELGLDPEALDLTTPEGLAGALRRAASYLCPCSAATLVRAVVAAAARAGARHGARRRSSSRTTLEAMISHGDVLEQPELQDGSPTAARAALRRACELCRASERARGPPRRRGRPALAAALRVGAANSVPRTRPQAQPVLGDRGPARRVAAARFARVGVRRVAQGPKSSTATQAVIASDRALDVVQPSRDIPGLLLLDPTKPVRYYRGRWTEPKTQTGSFVARRQQAYGADLWCYVHLTNGQPERMIDLPQPGSRWRGCDEAWHLQMAIDAQRGAPQRFRVTSSGDAVVLEIFSPAPAWARRRWDAIGEPVPSAGQPLRLPNRQGGDRRGAAVHAGSALA
jgi:hypothetical protein